MKARSFLIGSFDVHKLCGGFRSFVSISRIGSKRLCFVKAAGLVVIFLVASVAISAQGPCACKDKADLINQLNRANAALNTVEFYLKTANPSDMTNEIPDWPADNKETWKEILNGAISQASLDVDNSNAQVMIIKTDSSTCEPTVTAGACLKSIADKSAPAHKEVCMLEKNPRSGGGIAVEHYLRKMTEVYRAEIAEILKTLRALPKECKIFDWFGSITYIESTAENFVMDEGKTTVENTMIRRGRILVNGDPRPFSSWEVTGKYSYVKTGSSYSYCTATDRRSDKRTPYETSWRQEWDKTGSQPANIEVSIGEPEENRVPVSFAVPPIKMANKGGTTDSRKDGCPKASFNNYTPFNANIDLSASPVNSSAPYFKADPEKLSGSETKDIPSGTITVTFNLYRFGPPVRR